MRDCAQRSEFLIVVSNGHADACAAHKWISRVNVTAMQAQIACSGRYARLELRFEQFYRSEKRMARFAPVLNTHNSRNNLPFVGVLRKFMLARYVESRKGNGEHT